MPEQLPAAIPEHFHAESLLGLVISLPPNHLPNVLPSNPPTTVSRSGVTPMNSANVGRACGALNQRRKAAIQTGPADGSKAKYQNLGLREAIRPLVPRKNTAPEKARSTPVSPGPRSENTKPRPNTVDRQATRSDRARRRGDPTLGFLTTPDRRCSTRCNCNRTSQNSSNCTRPPRSWSGRTVERNPPRK
jgi:hypothetical protein